MGCVLFKILRKYYRKISNSAQILFSYLSFSGKYYMILHILEKILSFFILLFINWKKEVAVIKENQKLLNRLQVVLDGIVIIVSYVLAWFIRFKSGLFEQDPWALPLDVYMRLLLLIVPGYLILYYAFKLYAPKRVLGRRLEASRVIQANIDAVFGKAV